MLGVVFWSVWRVCLPDAFTVCRNAILIFFITILVYGIWLPFPWLLLCEIGFLKLLKTAVVRIAFLTSQENLLYFHSLALKFCKSQGLPSWACGLESMLPLHELGSVLGQGTKMPCKQQKKIVKSAYFQRFLVLHLYLDLPFPLSWLGSFCFHAQQSVLGVAPFFKGSLGRSVSRVL